MAIYDWKQPLNNRPAYGPTISNAKKTTLTPQQKLLVLQNYRIKRKKKPFETYKEPLQNIDLKSFEPKKTQASFSSSSKDTAFGKSNTGAFYKPFQEEKETKPDSFVKPQQPKPISFPKIQNVFKTVEPPKQSSWGTAEKTQKETTPNYFGSKSLERSTVQKEAPKMEQPKYSTPKKPTFYSDYLARQKKPYDTASKKPETFQTYRQGDTKPIQASKLTDREFYEKIPVKKWKDDFGDLLKKQQSPDSNEKNYAASSIKKARDEQQDIVEKYHSLLPGRKEIVDKKINDLDNSFHNKSNLYDGAQKTFDFIDSLNKEHTTSNKLKTFGNFVEEQRKKYADAANAQKPEPLKTSVVQAPNQEEKKVWAKEDIVLDENDKKLSSETQEKLIAEKLKWHNANTDEERKAAAEQGRLIRENHKNISRNASVQEKVQNLSVSAGPEQAEESKPSVEQEQNQEKKVWAKEDIVLDENDKKLSVPNQEKMINAKLKWHNAKDKQGQDEAAQAGKQIRESDKITSDSFREYTPETQRAYIKEITQKGNIQLDERDMGYLTDFLSNDQIINESAKGDMVNVLQRVLKQMGFDDIGLDKGTYSKETKAAIASIVELVTGNKNSGNKIGQEEKAKIVQLLSEIAAGDITITQKLKEKLKADINNRITPHNFTDYSAEMQRAYIKNIAQESNIQLNERDMEYLTDFLSNDQILTENAKGDMVKILQKVLQQMGFSAINEATGIYFEKTRAAIESIFGLVTNEKHTGKSIGKEEKKKIVQLLSEIAAGDTSIAQNLNDRFWVNYDQKRFDEATGKNKAAEQETVSSETEENSQQPNKSSGNFHDFTKGPFSNQVISAKPTYGEKEAQIRIRDKIVVYNNSIQDNFYKYTKEAKAVQKIDNAYYTKYGVKGIGVGADLALAYYTGGIKAVEAVVTENIVAKLAKVPTLDVDELFDYFFSGTLDNNIANAYKEYDEIMSGKDKFVLSKYNVGYDLMSVDYQWLKINYNIALERLKKEIDVDMNLSAIEKEGAKAYIDEIIQLNNSQ